MGKRGVMVPKTFEEKHSGSVSLSICLGWWNAPFPVGLKIWNRWKSAIKIQETILWDFPKIGKVVEFLLLTVNTVFKYPLCL